jgi:hypothetical protein
MNEPKDFWQDHRFILTEIRQLLRYCRHFYPLLLSGIFQTPLYAQPAYISPQPGKIFVSKTLQDLEILTDSILVTSIERHNKQGYEVRNDTLFIKNDYTWYGPNNSTGYRTDDHPYRIVKASSDTIILINYLDEFRRHSEEDTLQFVSMEKYKLPVTQFRHLNMTTKSGFPPVAVSVDIDSTGNIAYARYTVTRDGGNKSNLRGSGHFSKKEFENFKNVLSKSWLKRLKSEDCGGFDYLVKEFSLQDSEGTFICRGCPQMRLPQVMLEKYLSHLDINQGVKWNSKK